MKTIAVLTSGGDAPGMNACLRAVVRTALHHGLEIQGVMRGYEGLMEADFIPLDAKAVSNIIHRGGTMLKTARSQAFLKEEGQKLAAAQLAKQKIDGLIVIGGDGTFRGALALGKFSGVKIIGCPGTIDNDLHGTDFTIGYDTAINTVVDAVDKIRDTAESHERLFFVEVMGRDAGLIAMRSGIGAGAEAILIPESPTHIDDLVRRLEGGRKNKSSKIVIVSEHEAAGGAFAVAEQVKQKLPYYDTRVTILGHIQRGGNPSCMDRVNASRMGFAAVEALLAGHSGEMIGIIDKEVCYTPFANAVKHIEELDRNLLRMMEILSL
ncbi:MAG TPA: 6-phosphofructokinase [Bacteroidia bacterium]|jgi:6-phosphofructokinase 1|nr:6-phosphofructokinase [Bacteroidia bacterium]